MAELADALDLKSGSERSMGSSPISAMELSLNNFEYVGGGYYRLKGVPKGKTALIIHGPELLKQAQQLEETVKFLRKELKSMNPDVLTVDDPEILKDRVKHLEIEVAALRSQLEHRHLELAKLQPKIDKLSRYDKGIELISSWAQEKGDEFLEKLVELIEE